MYYRTIDTMQEIGKTELTPLAPKGEVVIDTCSLAWLSPGSLVLISMVQLYVLAAVPAEMQRFEIVARPLCTEQDSVPAALFSLRLP